jgi:hypothetical protein
MMSGTDCRSKLSRAQALETWAAARERVVSRLVQEGQTISRSDVTGSQANLRAVILRLRYCAQQERSEAMQLRAMAAAENRKRSRNNRS